MTRLLLNRRPKSVEKKRSISSSRIPSLVHLSSTHSTTTADISVDSSSPRQRTSSGSGDEMNMNDSDSSNDGNHLDRPHNRRRYGHDEPQDPFQARLMKCLKRRIKRHGFCQVIQEEECNNAATTATTTEEPARAAVSNNVGDDCGDDDDDEQSVVVPPLPLRRHRRRQRSQTTMSDSNSSRTTSSSSFSSSSSSSRTSSSQSLTCQVVLTAISPGHHQFFSSSSLLDMARMQQWQPILQRCNNCSRRRLRKQAKQVDADGLYPLHWALAGGAPATVVSELLRVYKKAARKTDSQGSTALSFACHYGSSVPVIRLLLGVYPEAVEAVDRAGRNALFHAVFKGCSLDMLQALVEKDPSSILTQCTTSGRTPLSVAWMDVMKDRRRRRLSSTTGTSTNRTTGGRINRSKRLDKAVFLLLTASGNVVPSRQDLYSTRPGVVLSALKLLPYLPNGAFKFIVDTFPEDVKRCDPTTGQLPLSVAASVVARERSDETINILLDAFPEAAQTIDNAGRTTLELAVTSGKNWNEGVEHLFQAAPDNLSTPTLPLFALAAMKKKDTTSESGTPTSSGRMEETHLSFKSKNKSKQSLKRKEVAAVNSNADHLTTVYELLRNDPAVIRNSVSA